MVPPPIPDVACALIPTLPLPSSSIALQNGLRDQVWSWMSKLPERPEGFARVPSREQFEINQPIDSENFRSVSERTYCDEVDESKHSTHADNRRVLRVANPSAPSIMFPDNESTAFADHDPTMFANTGSLIIIKGLPAGTRFGYDIKSFVVDGMFRGVRDVPKGVHFIWGASKHNSFRTGCWVIPSEISLKIWDDKQEIMKDDQNINGSQIKRASVYMDSLHPYKEEPTTTSSGSAILSKYPNIWSELTSSIDSRLLKRITGREHWDQWYVSTTHEAKHAYETLPAGSSVYSSEDEVFTFMFPKHKYTFNPNVMGRERTVQAMDTSVFVTSIMERDPELLVGELQFCYITGMILGNAACLEQWGLAVKTVFGAFTLTLTNPQFFQRFIKAVNSQLMFDNVGIEGSILDHEYNLATDLKLILTKFKSKFDELFMSQHELTEDQKAVGVAFEEFARFLWGFQGGWDIRENFVRSGRIQLEDGEFVDAETTDFEAEDERGEFAPAIVELDEDGREKGLISF